MKEWLINLAAGWFGAKKIWDKLDGLKVKLLAGASIASGIAGLLAQLAPIIEHKSASEALAFIQNAANNPAWLLILGGWGALGFGHKIDKQTEAIKKQTETLSQ